MKRKRKIICAVLGVTALGFLMLLLPFRNPVEGGNKNDYHPQSYWYYPWGSSVTHKGVDIFKKKGTPVRTAYPVELVLFAGLCQAREETRSSPLPPDGVCIIMRILTK